MALAGLWSRAQALIFGTAIGAAAGDSIAPVLQAVEQHANAQRAIRVLEPGTAARVEAQRLDTTIDPEDDAKRHGIGVARFRTLVELEQVAPGTAETLELWRRDKITREQAEHALHKAGLLEEFVGPVLELFNDRLKPAEIAVAVQRGILPNAGLLPVGPPTERGRVPPMPQVDLDPIAEAKSSGFDFDRLAVLTRIVGLPASPDLAARMTFRDLIDRVDFDRAIAEGNTRNEWAPFLFEGFREILTAHDYAELELRGFYDRDVRLENTGKHGMSEQDSDWLYDVLGRAVAVHGVTTGLARGGKWPSTYADVPEPFRSAIQRSNIREEWAGLAYANRYSYSVPFWWRALVTAGALTAAQGEKILLELGNRPDLAKLVAEHFAGGSTAAGKSETQAELADEYEGGYITEAEYRDALGTLGYSGPGLDLLVHLGDARRIKRYRELVVEAIGKAYVAFKIDDTTATGELAELNVTGDAATMLLALWQKQRRDAIRLLTPPQIKRAYTRGLIDNATAIAELEERGYTPADAATLLAE